MVANLISTSSNFEIFELEEVVDGCSLLLTSGFLLLVASIFYSVSSNWEIVELEVVVGLSIFAGLGIL